MPITSTLPNLSWTSEAAVYNGKIYFFGGYASSAAVNITWEFNPSTLAFTQKANLPTAGYGASTAVLNGKIYVIGGNYRTNKVEIYNPANNTWAPSLSFSNMTLWGWDAAAPLGTKIAIAAGDTGATFLFNPANNTLSAQQAMPRARGNGSDVTGEGVGGRLYVAGGGATSGSNLLDSFKPNPAAAAVQQAPLSEMEASVVPEPDYKAIEAEHLRIMEQIQIRQEAAGR